MLITSTTWKAALKGAAFGTLLAGATMLPAAAQTVYGLASVAGTAATSLVTFVATAPGTFTATVPITGLGVGQTLVGLDARPNTGQLFALGYNPTGTQVQLYTLSTSTGALSPVGAALTLNLGTTTGRIGFDFNPTVDRIRVTGSNNSNFRLNPNNGALAATDTNLAYATTDANAAQTPGVGAVAYGNSYIGATATVLYDIDEANSRYTTQDPPNAGTLNSRAQLTVNTATALATDLDIYFSPTSRANNAYLTIATGTAATPTTQLYTLDFIMGTGMTAVGAIGPVGTLVTDIAFAIDRPATLPAVTGQLTYALAGNNLLTFDTAQPSLIRTSVGITGVDATQTLVGMDIRPTTNTLYGLGYNATAQTYQLYTINSQTGAAAAVNTTPIALALGTGKVGFDFNPTVDRIRVVGANRANFRLNPTDGTVAATDTQLAYAAGDRNAGATPTIGAAAYTNSVAGATATSTTLYDYDLALNVLALQNPPNDGNLISVGTFGNSGIVVNTAVPNVDIDIYAPAQGTMTMYMVANTGTDLNSSLYTVNQFNIASTVTLVGPIGNGIAARDIAIAGPTGVVTAARERTDLATGFNLYPNPASGTTRLTFALARTGRVELGVFDAMGRRVATQTSGMLPTGAQTLRLETSSLKAGLYVVRLVVDGQPAAARQMVVE
ncbi:DUF4394 domain-containing protein [Hymenobacter sp. BT770]|uniref:DUF4394 domain-containing protein n=1 Tax=Hymenobacter sp. BT770 TaxID=2886942 RepID=UPI001D1039E5|nr:DUF4394 domain-containing protein [Hymenobacter sp. BT770]MCC3152693.1 DUF4394 domain-containing protein [Hymenobacter sp. BT770]MDO3414766.1 DUF4394 domain-containing protein [Hymenobacter sp. BT770]